jgi:hypothetical protein
MQVAGLKRNHFQLGRQTAANPMPFSFGFTAGTTASNNSAVFSTNHGATSGPSNLQFGTLTFRRSNPRVALVTQFVSKDLLDNQVIVRVPKRKDQSVSPFFLMTNSDGSYRGILNVKTLNIKYLQTQKFKMETLLKVLPLIREGDWFGSWDIRKGYYNIAVHPDFQRFFCFDLDGQRYMFKCYGHLHCPVHLHHQAHGHHHWLCASGGN